MWISGVSVYSINASTPLSRFTHTPSVDDFRLVYPPLHYFSRGGRPLR